MAARAISGLLGKSDALAHLRDHALRLRRLQHTVDAALPAQMRGAAAVANLQDGELILHVSSPGLASRLKLSATTLLGSLQAAGEPVVRLKIRVRARNEIGTRTTQNVEKRHIGGGGRESLRELQSSLGEDSPLGRALQRMIKDSG